MMYQINRTSFLIVLLALLTNLLIAQGGRIPVPAKNGMVVSSHYLGSQVGKDILAKGGNAIDAAVGTAFASTSTPSGSWTSTTTTRPSTDPPAERGVTSSPSSARGTSAASSPAGTAAGPLRQVSSCRLRENQLGMIRFLSFSSQGLSAAEDVLPRL